VAERLIEANGVDLCALAEVIPGARLMPLEGAGHGVERPDWERIVHAILEHTAAGQRGLRGASDQ
jgi:hypothetical protein